jgi:hypothetical protein
MRWAKITVVGTPTTAEWIRLFGGAMGLGKPQAGVDSVMLPQGSSPTITQPTTKDETAICTLYGTPPLCGE